VGAGQWTGSQSRRVFTATGLATTYAEAREERHLLKLERAIDARDLIIVDELGYVPLGQGAAENLFGFTAQAETGATLATTGPDFPLPTIHNTPYPHYTRA
jgi:hypothetical protein